MRKLAIILIIACSLLFLFSCSSSESGSMVTTTYATATQTATKTYSAAPSVPSTRTSSGGQAAPADRMTVRSGDMSVVVEDVIEGMDRIGRLAEERQGYIVSSQNWRDTYGVHGYISIRVPSTDFTAVMQAVRDMALEVTTQSTSSQDVTEEYVDLNAKLQNLQATETQLLLIMSKAEITEDVLAVQRELTNVRSEIEQIKGRMQYLEQTSSTSLLSINLSQSQLETSLTAEQRIAGTGELIQFYSEVGGGFPPYNYEWDFGDGATVREVNPQHSYQSTGTFTVTLKVTDDRNNSTTSVVENYITIQPGWSIGDTFQSAWNGFMSFGRVWVNVMVWVGIFSPIWIVGAGAYFGVRYYRKRRKNSKTD